MKENIYWFVGGYIYCIIINYIMNLNIRKKIKNENINN